MLTEGYFQCIFAINLRKNCTVHRLVSLKSYLKRNLKKKKKITYSKAKKHVCFSVNENSRKTYGG